MTVSLEHQRREYRAIYEAIFENQRIFVKDIASILQIDSNTASRRLKEAFERGYISKPQIRRRSYQNMREYVYFVNCKNPVKLFSQCRENDTILYHSVLTGFANFWIVSKEKIDILDIDNIVIKGYRSDYHMSYAPNYSWRTSIRKMREMVKTFNPAEYSPKPYIKTRWDEPLEWDAEQEKLFQAFNYDLRKAVSRVMRENLISWRKMEVWLKNLSKYCTVVTAYYPETISAYDPYLFVFETDYEDFIVDLFSMLPTTSLFFKVSNKLFLYAHVKRKYLRVVDFQIDIRRLQIPTIVEELLNRGVIQSKTHALVECYWQEDP